MSIDGIKQELSELDPLQRHQIVAFLVSMHDQQDIDYRSSLTRKIDDSSPEKWATLEQLDQRLSINESDRSE